MATTIVVRFVLGRYHATPWGTHVNEGRVELPPSPWRLLRALYSVWKTRTPELSEASVHAVLTKLGEPPTYFVPPYRLAHTRHYYPDTKHRSGALSIDLTLDAFAVLDRDAELGIRWPLDLDVDEGGVLARLSASLPYLGRADSLCEARLDNSWCMNGHAICEPQDVESATASATPAVQLLAPTLPLDMEALTRRPAEVRSANLRFPGGTRFVAYPRLQEAARIPVSPRASAKPVEAVRFSITQTVLPPETDAVALADHFRQSAVSSSNRLRGDVHRRSALAGKDEGENALMGHRHAHYFALANSDRRLEEVAVWAPGGLASDEFEALARVQSLWGPRRVGDECVIDVRMSAYGDEAHVLDDLVGCSRHWRSKTPFAPARHGRRSQEWTTFLANEVQRELAYRGLPAADTVVVSTRERDWREFVRYRPSRRFAGDARSSPPAAFLELTFSNRVRGPIALGHLAHFGLGLFTPIPDG